MTTTRRCWPAPAKLNLFLHITGRRADGYHQLQSVFQFLDYGDELAFSLRGDGEVLRTSDLPGVPAERDLVVRAAKLLLQHANCSQGVEIAVEKRLPMGGGLGGGSSNAATTLVALNELCELGLSVDDLATLGLQLGADVPVFVRGSAAWAEGVGEQLTPLEGELAPPEPWYLVIEPACSVATEVVFNAPDLTRDCHPITISHFLAGQGSNVCEAVVKKRFPLVANALDFLLKYAPARMSGTGACVFAAFDERAAAQGVLELLPKEWKGFVAKGMNRSPLYIDM
ncbi:MAG: 4-(cytidine 5'-diphospho)-2-C-methyl-D-erythritol kinase [Gammaproteobacteria bacterium]|nr:4-(cytidine 5'-diphospho)-2-C-methyl-D-erythritol kinase [Gammaproteobacteria bacterium]